MLPLFCTLFSLFFYSILFYSILSYSLIIYNLLFPCPASLTLSLSLTLTLTVSLSVCRNGALALSVASYELQNHHDMTHDALCVSMIVDMCCKVNQITLNQKQGHLNATCSDLVSLSLHCKPYISLIPFNLFFSLYLSHTPSLSLGRS